MNALYVLGGLGAGEKSFVGTFAPVAVGIGTLGAAAGGYQGYQNTDESLGSFHHAVLGTTVLVGGLSVLLLRGSGPTSMNDMGPYLLAMFIGVPIGVIGASGLLGYHVGRAIG